MAAVFCQGISTRKSHKTSCASKVKEAATLHLCSNPMEVRLLADQEHLGEEIKWNNLL